MKLPTAPTGLSTLGATGVALMVLHILGHLNGWGWTVLYVTLIAMGIGQENRK